MCQKKTIKKRSVERKIFFYKITCNVDGKECKINEIFDSYIELLDSNYENLEARNLAVPYFEKCCFLDISKHPYGKDVHNGVGILRELSLEEMENAFQEHLEERERSKAKTA